MNHLNEEHPNQSVSRRDALKTLAAIGGATALSTIPSQWQKPIVQVGALPAFAQASPGQFPFTNEIESVEFEGNDGPLQTAIQPGWIIVAPEGSTVGSATYDYPWIILQPWIKIKRKFDIIVAPGIWGTLTIKIKIKIKFFAKPGFGSSNAPADNTDIWLFGISGANLGLFQYYVIKAKITQKKVEFVYQVPAISSGFWPFYFSVFFPFTIVLVNGSSLFPGFYLGPGIYGDQVSSSFLD